MISLTLDLDPLFKRIRKDLHEEIRFIAERLVTKYYKTHKNLKGLVEVVNPPLGIGEEFNEEFRGFTDEYLEFFFEVVGFITDEFCGGHEKFAGLLKSVSRGRREITWVQLEWVNNKNTLNIRAVGPRKEERSEPMKNATMVVVDIAPVHKHIRNSLKPLLKELHPGVFPPSTVRLQLNELDEIWWRWLVDTIHPHLYNNISDHLDARILLFFDTHLDVLEDSVLRSSGIYDVIEGLPSDYHYMEVHLSGDALFLIMSKNDFKEGLSE